MGTPSGLPSSSGRRRHRRSPRLALSLLPLSPTLKLTHSKRTSSPQTMATTFRIYPSLILRVVQPAPLTQGLEVLHRRHLLIRTMRAAT